MQLFKDDFSIITLDADAGILTLAWTAATSNMTDKDFQKVNLAYADLSIEHATQKLVVDVRQFGHSFGTELGGWRLNNVIPKYHQAGVTKMAFVHGDGFEEPPSGRKEDGENFITRHFATAASAEAWLAEA